MYNKMPAGLSEFSFFRGTIAKMESPHIVAISENFCCNNVLFRRCLSMQDQWLLNVVQCMMFT